MADTTELAALLAHADWLRRLARMLVGPSAADDAVQDTYVAALRSPPDPALPARPWLSRVLRNATRMAHRTSTRRAHREDAFVASRAPAGIDDAVARAETFRTLVELVLALGEPYRTVLVRHYFDGDTFAEIARRDGVPEATVRGRHKHALEQLRAQLDARARGDRGAWLAALAPVATPPAHAASVTAGVVIMNKLVIGIVIAIAAAVAVWQYPHVANRLRGSSAAVAPPSDRQAPGQALDPGHSIDAALPVQHVRQLASAERQQVADRIAAAQALRAKRKQAAMPAQSDQTLPSSSSPPHEGDMDKTVIRAAMQEVLPFLGDCYGEARGSTLDADHLEIHAKFRLTGDRDIGTVIDARQLVDDDGHALPAKLDDCLRSTLQTLELPPLGDGETVDVDYPLLFNDGSGG